MYFNLTAFCIGSSRNLASQYLIRDHMVVHYNRVLSAKGKNVHVWMNCLPLNLAQSLRIASYQEGMNWIVGNWFFLPIHVSARRCGFYSIILLYYWDGKSCMKTFSLNVTKCYLILKYFVLYWLHSAFDEIMNYEIIGWNEGHSDSHNSKHTEIVLGMKAEHFYLNSDHNVFLLLFLFQKLNNLFFILQWIVIATSKDCENCLVCLQMIKSCYWQNPSSQIQYSQCYISWHTQYPQGCR